MAQPLKASNKFVPDFPHAHYHSYAVENRRLVDINPNLKVRAADIMTVCDKLGARSVMDVGSNLGGFLFYLEQYSDRSRLLGIEGDKRWVDRCEEVVDHLYSRVEFLNKNVLSVEPMDDLYDAMILQNVYHYIYDKIGSHQPIFDHFAKLARSIVSYNPMSKNDPVIGEHANSNPNANWDRYTHKDIFEAAIKAGFLHPIPDKLSRFSGMGSVREHWIFVQDNVVPIDIHTIPLSSVKGREVELRAHYRPVHTVTLDETRSYKVFKPGFENRMKGVLAAVKAGLLDETLCPGLEFIVNDGGEMIGYAQPRGVDLVTWPSVGGDEIKRRFHRQQWRLLSRMLRHDMFNHDIGAHNFVVLPGHPEPMFIDLEGFVQNASQGEALSVNHRHQNPNEVHAAESNLKPLFSGVDLRIRDRDPISILWEGLSRSDFLANIDYDGLLAR